MIKGLSPTKAVLLLSVLISAGGHFGLYMPEKNIAHSARVYGVSGSDSLTEELTSISQMPFLSNRANRRTVEKLVISDDIFYQPPVIVESVEQVPLDEPDIIDYMPVGITPPESDYTQWASENISLQSVTSTGVIINDRFYKIGQSIDIKHQFDDGSYFTGSVKRTEGKLVFIEINKGLILDLELGKKK